MPREPRKPKPKHATYEGGDERTLKRIPTPPKHWAWNPPEKKAPVRKVKLKPEWITSKLLATYLAIAKVGFPSRWLVTYDHPIRGQHPTHTDWLQLLQALLTDNSGESIHIVEWSWQHHILNIQEIGIEVHYT